MCVCPDVRLDFSMSRRGRTLSKLRRKKRILDVVTHKKYNSFIMEILFGIFNFTRNDYSFLRSNLDLLISPERGVTNLLSLNRFQRDVRSSCWPDFTSLGPKWNPRKRRCCTTVLFTDVSLPWLLGFLLKSQLTTRNRFLWDLLGDKYLSSWTGFLNNLMEF